MGGHIREKKQTKMLFISLILVTVFNLLVVGFYGMYLLNLYEEIPLVYLLDTILFLFCLSLLCLFLFSSDTGRNSLERAGLGGFYMHGNFIYMGAVAVLIFPITARLGFGACAVISLMVIAVGAMNLSVLIGCIVDLLCTFRRRRKYGRENI